MYENNTHRAPKLILLDQKIQSAENLLEFWDRFFVYYSVRIG
ncbi:hypothetical protein LEP1GSC084_1265 [Leptospira interrogans serovar Medanensis str. L0448]|nr:hypothetical protein LEP1GSC084_1265 [Leptospira interrogans serovar Medanensis str. L0448]EMN96843.1 hypothetical protein LEP1GSC110_4406 [Leptospira interrogans serovar Medanensis str. UT053]